MGNFEKVINKAKDACKIAGEEITNHFPDVGKMVAIGSFAEKEIDDIALTRYVCYLVAQKGDSRKAAVAFAPNYFAVQTRRAELAEQRLLDFERVKAREKLSHTEKQLSGILTIKLLTFNRNKLAHLQQQTKMINQSRFSVPAFCNPVIKI